MGNMPHIHTIPAGDSGAFLTALQHAVNEANIEIKTRARDNAGARSRTVASIMEIIDAVNVDYDASTTDEEIRVHAASVARFIACAADYLNDYIATGILPKLDTEADEPEDLDDSDMTGNEVE